LFGLLKNLRRKELRAAPFPERWEEILRQNVSHYRRLDTDEREKLRGDLRVFMAEKDWEGCRGQEITDEVQVTIAAQACLLTLHLDGEPYPNVSSVLVYPAGYVAPERAIRPGGIVDERKSHRIGEAWSHGPIVLSWADALEGGRNESDGRNLVFHEFAHKLDMRSGPPNGVPRLMTDAQYEEWSEVMSAEFSELVARSHYHEATLLDKYGSRDGAEFFACATECFFELPLDMREQHPRLYGVLRDYYRQDPAEREA
jgi:MtfA peptidase